MPSVFDKLNLKDQREILVLNAPASFAPSPKRALSKTGKAKAGR